MYGLLATAATPDTARLPGILVSARAGHRQHAESFAARWEAWALHTYGLQFAEAIHWLEVRADLAHLARHQASDAEPVQTAVHRAVIDGGKSRTLSTPGNSARASSPCAAAYPDERREPLARYSVDLNCSTSCRGT